MEWSIPGIWFYMDRMVHIKSGRLIIYVHISFIFSSILEILDIWFLYVLQNKNARRKTWRRMPQFSSRDLSYETDSGPKSKTVYHSILWSDKPSCGVIHSTKGLSLHLGGHRFLDWAVYDIGFGIGSCEIQHKFWGCIGHVGFWFGPVMPGIIPGL